METYILLQNPCLRNANRERYHYGGVPIDYQPKFFYKLSLWEKRDSLYYYELPFADGCYRRLRDQRRVNGPSVAFAEQLSRFRVYGIREMD